MEIIIHVDVLKMHMRELVKKLRKTLDYICVIGVVAAGLASFIYLCHSVFIWLTVV